ncbi:hypothetical protein K3495_g5006 [Podosphaera aphanis]|nr:hypothetical protein K3495_g5006 [Podosphaera aphanis]
MLKKQTSLLLSCSNRHCLYVPGPAPKTSTLSSKSQTQQQHYRSYAKTSDAFNQESKISWPECSSVNAIPTPYEIFNQKKCSPYSKQRFYELVKLYHPDRHDINTKVAGLSYETKLERYRLVVAANDILGNPTRRSAYDRFGAGWNGKPDISSSQNSSQNAGYAGGKEWYEGPDGPSQNATWEDWERWYARDGTQEQNFVSNAAFVGIILTFALLGGIGQVTRAGNYSMNFLEQRDALHEKVSKELAQIKRESSKYQFQEERINRFIKSRDASGYRMNDTQEENLRKLLESPDICSGRRHKKEINNREKRQDTEGD